ncbi:MAG TPA: hypothetical protein PLT01_05355 [Bacteroidaceae bacterium]|nr:hypothetical protein [Bacteroidaceae bacterium]
MKKKTRLAIWETSTVLLFISLFLLIIGIIFGANDDFLGTMILILFFSILGFFSFVRPHYDEEEDEE